MYIYDHVCSFFCLFCFCCKFAKRKTSLTHTHTLLHKQMLYKRVCFVFLCLSLKQLNSPHYITSTRLGLVTVASGKKCKDNKWVPRDTFYNTSLKKFLFCLFSKNPISLWYFSFCYFAFILVQFSFVCFFFFLLIPVLLLVLISRFPFHTLYITQSNCK